MNRVYKKVWNTFRQKIVVVSEASSSQTGKARANTGMVSAKAGVMVAMSTTIVFASVQALAETAFDLDALSPEDVVSVTSIPSTVDEANAAQSALYAETVLTNTATGSDKTALVFASEDYNENLFYKKSNRITQSMGFKGITGATGGVEVADGMHLVLVGESTDQENTKNFALVDGALYVHGKAVDATSRITLGSYATEGKTAGRLNDIYVGVQPNSVGHANNGQLYVRHGDFTAKNLYLGGQVFIGGGIEEKLPEDKEASLTVETLSAESQSELHNWGTFTASTITMPKGTANARLYNYGTMNLTGKQSLFNGFIHNSGSFNGKNLALFNGVVLNAEGGLDFAPSENLAGAHQVCLLRRSHQVLVRHNFINLLIHIAFEAQISIRDYADQMHLIVHHRNPANVIFAHQLQGIPHGATPLDRHWVINHAVFRTLHDSHLFGLLFNRHILVYHANTAFACYCDGHRCLRYGIHRSRHEWNLQRDIPGEFCTKIHHARQYVRISGYQ